ncbi:hypothetical protein Emed_002655 [Eimeria media]
MEAVDVNAVVSRVAAKKGEWAALALARKLELLDLLLDNLNANLELLQEASKEKRDGPSETAPSYAALSKDEAKVLQNASKAAHYLHSAMLISNWLGVIREYYDAVVKTGAPPPPMSVRELPTEKGQPQRFAVKVGPKGLLHTTLVTYGTMELIVEGPVEQELLHQRPAGVTAVLGAGNFDGPVDLLTSLFIENKVCVYKASPMNTLLLEPMKRIFAPLLEHDYAAILIGDVAEARILLNHPEVEKWYMTGSAATAYRIIWGEPTPPKPPAKPLLDKPMTVELGNCTPWIVCPGKWEEFLHLIRTYINDTHYVGCYYPDFHKRMEEARDQLMKLGKKAADFEIPVKCPIAKNTEVRSIIFATDLPQDCFLTQHETFSPVCGEVPLDTLNTIEAFLPVATKYANEGVHGGLSISVSVRPTTPEHEKALENAIRDLHYGAVHINTDTKLSIAFPALAWGGCPGSTIYELNSGIGFMGNCFGFKRPIKSVIRAPYLNFTHMLLAAPNKSNAAKMAKLWRRITNATIQRRSTQSWWNFAGNLTKIASAFAANL